MRQMIAAILMVFAAPALAQETIPLPDNYSPPEADLSQMEWLEGHWEGIGIGGNPATESWLPATGNTMVGTFVQADDEGNIRFSEHMYLMEEAGSLILRLKHFEPNLDSWEERDETTDFRLVSLEHCNARFGGLTIRCEGDDGLVIAVRISNAEGQIGEMLFNFMRAGEASPSARQCADAMTTLDMNDCYSAMFGEAEDRRMEYLAAALMKYADQAELAAMIRASDEAFSAYRDAECGAVLERWREGSIRTIISIGCQIEMTDAHTHRIWENWLTYMDSTPALLPEPEPSL